ncbi:MAG: AI-2E family transporter [Acidobacteria bacterium]|nr:AI-2E family transporter [Acidobacteriota bacterium]
MVGGIGYFLFFLMAFLSLTILLIWPVFPYVVLGILLTYLFHPLEKRLQETIRSPGIRAGLLTLFATLIISFPLVYAVQRLSREIGSPTQLNRMKQLLENARTWLQNHQAEMFASWIGELAEQGRNFILGHIPGLFGSVFSIALGLFVCLFVFYYFTKEGEHIWQALMNAIPLPNRLKSRLNQEVTGVVRAILYGQMVTAIVQGAIGGIGLAIFQVPQPLLLTVLMILLSFLPFVGAPLVWVPAGVLKLMAGQTWQGLGLLIYGSVLILNIDNVIRPRLISLHSQVHPVVILIGIIGGTKVFGFIGFLVGPVIFAIFLQLLRFFAEYHPVETETPVQPPVQPSVRA